jgi:glucosylceramidase
MKMLPHEQIEFVNGYLGPELERNNIDAKILAYDHNWDNVEYAIAVLQNAGRYVDGSAWHCYGGTHNAMTIVNNKFPDKGIWFTEASGGEWVPPFHAAFADQMMHVIRSIRNYSRSVVWWNIALDQYNGPTVLENSTCRGIVTINTYTGEIEYNLDYYTMGHISKFVKPGALRIDSDNYMNDVESVAFENPDKSIVLIVSNRTANDRVLNIKYGKSDFKFDLPGRAAVTFRWLSE